MLQNCVEYNYQINLILKPSMQSKPMLTCDLSLGHGVNDSCVDVFRCVYSCGHVRKASI